MSKICPKTNRWCETTGCGVGNYCAQIPPSVTTDHTLPLESVVPSSGKSLEEIISKLNGMLVTVGSDKVSRTYSREELIYAAELYAKSCTEELRKENEELRRRINELEFPEYPQDQREAVGKILAENITFSPQAGGWVIHGAIDKIIQWASLPSAPIEKT